MIVTLFLDREVSPKFVFGQKKYGRRSRPESTDQETGGQDTIIDDADCDTFLPPVTNNKDYKVGTCLHFTFIHIYL